MSSDSDNDDQQFSGFYGKALEPYDEDTIPKKRAIPIEDQVAKDAQGRRRFHGAFTGGFSAGFYNTVGSLEGWKPSEFKSSRSSKAENKQRHAQDYMDEEDMSEFGIAPQTVKATDEYNTSRKRKKQQMSDGPIPGEPVLQTLIDSGNETIGYLLLRHMGYKHTNEDEDENNEEDNNQDINNDDEQSDSKRVYGCEMPKSYSNKKSLKKITCNIPEIYKNALSNPKSNTFGMGYSGLDRSHINLFTSSKLVVTDRNNKKLSISGQAFGVGAFEDDDEDIYVKEDLSKYDFEMTTEKTKEKPRDTRKLILDMFVQAVGELSMIEKFPPPNIPSSFTGKHKVRKSRFEPQQTSSDKEVAPQRHEIDAATRAMILGEGTSNARSEAPKSSLPKTPAKPQETVREVEVKREDVAQRGTMFDVGPAGLIFDKFVSAGKSESHADLLENVQRTETTHGTKDMRDAAKKKMFGPLTRVVVTWLPNALLCKRFNVPEPVFSDSDFKTKHKRHRNLIFENASALGNVPETENVHEAGLQSRNKSIAAQSSIPPEIPVIEIISAPESVSNNANVASGSVTATASLPTSVSTPSPAKIVEKKTALDPTEKLDISKNVDLFKAVFMDSDSDEEDNADDDKTVDKRPDQEGDISKNEEERRARDAEIKAKILTEDLLLPQIKPIKQGILSNVESMLFDTPTITVQEPPKQASLEEVKEIIDEGMKNFISSDNMYGPRLPEKITFRKPGKSTNLPKQNIDSGSQSDSDWVEKSDKPKTSEKKHKHKKQKHKRDKHKHKKHKSKRDR